MKKLIINNSPELTLLSVGIGHYLMTADAIGEAIYIIRQSGEIDYAVPVRNNCHLEAEDFSRFTKRIDIIKPYLMKEGISLELRTLSGPATCEFTLYALRLPNKPSAFLLVAAMLMTSSLPVAWGTSKYFADYFLKQDPKLTQLARMAGLKANTLISHWNH